jgi:hypothetical protein
MFGDFNIYCFSEKNVSSFKQLTESLSYVQLVTKPTFVLYVYVNHKHGQVDLRVSHDTQVGHEKMEANVVSVYYSDHEAVRVIVRF